MYRAPTVLRKQRSRIAARLLEIIVAAVFGTALHAQQPPAGLPAVLIPAPPSIAARPDAPIAPFRLLGFDVRTDTREVPIHPIAFPEDIRLAFTLYWIPLGTVPQDANLVLRIKGSGPELKNEYTVDLHERQIGVLQRQPIDFPFDGLRYSGDATLSMVSHLADGSEFPHYIGPVRVLPRSFPSRIDGPAFQQAFGPSAVPILSQFRLGLHASLKLDLHAAGPTDGIAVVSSTGYDGDPRQGARVCTVRLLDAKGQALATDYLVQGVTTAKSDFDFYPAGTLRAKKIAIFNSAPAPGPNQSGQPYSLHTYAATLPMKTHVPPAAISFEYDLNDAVLDVKAIGLLPAKVDTK